MFERSLLSDDLGRRRSLFENDRVIVGLFICVLDCGLSSIALFWDISELETDFHDAVFGLDLDVSTFVRLVCEAVLGLLLLGRSEYVKST